MLELRPLLVLTGNIRVEGGEKVKSQQTEPDIERGKEHFSVVRETTITKPRRRGNVIVTDFWRRLRAIRLLHTPMGHLIDPEKKNKLNEIIAHTDNKISEFNRDVPDTCRVYNCLIVEKLSGVRQAKTAGWIATHTRVKEIKDILDQLRA